MQENKASFVAQEALLQEREESLARHTSSISSLQVNVRAAPGYQYLRPAMHSALHPHISGKDKDVYPDCLDVICSVRMCCMLCRTQAQLRETQQRLSEAAEGHWRETAQLQAQLRQISEERSRDAQELESAQEELQRQKEHHESDRQRLTKRQEGLLKVHIKPARALLFGSQTRMTTQCHLLHVSHDRCAHSQCLSRA